LKNHGCFRNNWRSVSAFSDRVRITPGSLYSEVRTGAEIYLRKMLIPQMNIEGKLGYRYEIVDIANVTADASSVIQSLAGNNSLSMVTFQLLRDTRDKIINTTKGTRAEFNAGVAGGLLGGKENYYSLEFRGSQFIPVFDTQTQVLALLFRGGVKQNYGKSTTVPYYDRFFLGGPYDLRGYEYRDIGPKDSTGEPIGGKTYGFFSAEYSMDIVSPIRVGVFYDAGFVNKGAYDFGPGQYSDNFGLGLHLYVAGQPLTLDFGIPLNSAQGSKKGNQFNFSFGTRY